MCTKCKDDKHRCPGCKACRVAYSRLMQGDDRLDLDDKSTHSLTVWQIFSRRFDDPDFKPKVPLLDSNPQMQEWHQELRKKGNIGLEPELRAHTREPIHLKVCLKE